MVILVWMCGKISQLFFHNKNHECWAGLLSIQLTRAVAVQRGLIIGYINFLVGIAFQCKATTMRFISFSSPTHSLQTRKYLIIVGRAIPYDVMCRLGILESLAWLAWELLRILGFMFLISDFHCLPTSCLKEWETVNLIAVAWPCYQHNARWDSVVSFTPLHSEMGEEGQG